jgi:hypothetical protein
MQGALTRLEEGGSRDATRQMPNMGALPGDIADSESHSGSTPRTLPSIPSPEKPGTPGTGTAYSFKPGRGLTPPPPEEGEGEEDLGREMSRKEIRAALAEDPTHCPRCGTRMKRKTPECRKCGLLIPKRGGFFKKLLVFLAVLLLLVVGAGAALHFTGRLPGVLRKIPYVKDHLPSFLKEPATGDDAAGGESEAETTGASAGN